MILSMIDPKTCRIGKYKVWHVELQLDGEKI